MSSESFGPTLRWRRVRQGISLEQISEQTNVPVKLWEAMEADDFSAWPSGIYIRSRLRDYADIVGLDGDAVVDDFCRMFPTRGDRRRETLVRGQAEIIGHTLTAVEPSLPEGVREDRRAPRSTAPPGDTRGRRPAIDMRAGAAIVDQLLVVAIAGGIGVATGHFWMVLALGALVYHAAGVATLGCSPAAWFLRALAARHGRTVRPDVFTPLPRTIDHS